MSLKVTNKSARVVTFNLGGGAILQLSPLATIDIEDSNTAVLEPVQAALDGVYKPLVDSGELVVEVVTPPPPEADPPADPNPTGPIDCPPPTPPTPAPPTTGDPAAPAYTTTTTKPKSSSK